MQNVAPRVVFILQPALIVHPEPGQLLCHAAGPTGAAGDVLGGQASAMGHLPSVQPVPCMVKLTTGQSCLKTTLQFSSFNSPPFPRLELGEMLYFVSFFSNYVQDWDVDISVPL